MSTLFTKKNIFCILLLVVSLTTLFVYTKYISATTDKVPPKITCESKEIICSVDEATEEFLLQGVTAYDKVSGDVTDSLVIQSISHFIQKDKVIVTYAAVDDDNNVGRLERTLTFTGYKEPTFDLTKPLIYPAGTNINFLNNIRANSIVDGDLSTQIRYGLDSIVDNSTPSTYPISFRTTDSLGRTSYLDTEIVIINNLYTTAEINLSEYLIYIPLNSKFGVNEAEKYIKEISAKYEPKDLIVDCKVDTSTAGVYNVDYTLNATNANGKSRLVVVVKPD